MRVKEISDFREGFFKERLDLLKGSVSPEKIARHGGLSFVIETDTALACTLAGADYDTVMLLCKKTLETKVTYEKAEDGKFELCCCIAIDGAINESLSVFYVLGADVLDLFDSEKKDEEEDEETADIEAWKEKHSVLFERIRQHILENLDADELEDNVKEDIALDWIDENPCEAWDKALGEMGTYDIKDKLCDAINSL